MTVRKTELMHGGPLAGEIIDQVRNRAGAFASNSGRPPCLAAVLVGDDPASVTYVRMKQRRSAAAGMTSKLVVLPETASTEEVVAVLHDLSHDDGVDGILLQHPVPREVDERSAFEAIAPHKDVDGVTMHSFAAMAFGAAGFQSCTPAGMLRLLDAYGVELAGRHAVVIGRSPILGKPIGMLLLGRDATVTTCHSHTERLERLVRTGDIVVAATGHPHLVRGSWLRSGAVVLDAGYNADNRGDVVLEEAMGVASLITPVPGGVGPMTIALLLEQTVAAAEGRHDSLPSTPERS
ncbi:MAG: bifunctional 5,10-methylenetetrahydrofolate dehydrogenase/5,10-methenyltetrahydrofolate cyclohydrolase [Acidimicrobiales bacterium]